MTTDYILSAKICLICVICVPVSHLDTPSRNNGDMLMTLSASGKFFHKPVQANHVHFRKRYRLQYPEMGILADISSYSSIMSSVTHNSYLPSRNACHAARYGLRTDNICTKQLVSNTTSLHRQHLHQTIGVQYHQPFHCL